MGIIQKLLYDYVLARIRRICSPGEAISVAGFFIVQLFLIFFVAVKPAYAVDTFLFGVDNTGTPTQTAYANYTYCDYFTSPATSTVNKIKFYGQSVSYLRFAIYEFVYPYTLLNSIQVNNPTVGWQEATFPNTSVTSGTLYLLCLITPTDATLRMAGAHGGYQGSGGTFQSTMPDYSYPYPDTWAIGAYNSVVPTPTPTLTPTPTPIDQNATASAQVSQLLYGEFTNEIDPPDQAVYLFIKNWSDNLRITGYHVKLGGAGINVTGLSINPQHEQQFTIPYGFGDSEELFPAVEPLYYYYLNLEDNSTGITYPIVTYQGVNEDNNLVPIIPETCTNIDIFCQFKQWFWGWTNYIFGFNTAISKFKSNYNKINIALYTKRPFNYLSAFSTLDLGAPLEATYTAIPDFHISYVNKYKEIPVFVTDVSVSASKFAPAQPFITTVRTAFAITLWIMTLGFIASWIINILRASVKK